MDHRQHLLEIVVELSTRVAELVASLQPDFIYLTHIHWDHFQGFPFENSADPQ
jgi:glyoxylase-like metal-dependent hydrolase (beta-lactamase superfamily II)